MGRNGSTSEPSIPRVVSCFALLALLIFQLAATSPAATIGDDSSPVSTATVEGRLAVFDDVWETIRERYYDPTFHGIDWQAERTKIRPAAARAANQQELYEVLRQMIALLRDAHTRVYSPDEKFDWWNPRFVTVGLTLREVDGVPTVIQVESGSAAARTGIRAGDVVVSVDSIPVAKILAQRLPGSGENGSARYRAIANLLEGTPESTVKIGWLNRQGKRKSATLARYWNQRHLGFSNRRKGDIAILRIDAFTQSVATEFARALPHVLEGAAGIVLDLRANGGGDAEAMADVASLFLDDGTSLGKFADRSGASFELQTFSRRFWTAKKTSPTKLPLVVLTSENTSSAAEILVATLRAKRRVHVIGANTCGCVLAIRNRHALPDGGVLDVSEFDYRTADGLRLEGAGVKPDKSAPLTRADIYASHDRALELAKRFLSKS